MKPSKVGRKIKYYREESKLTQQQLADKIGVTWEMVSRYERGINEPYSRIKSIAKALNTNISELLQEDNIASVRNQIPLFTKIPKDLNFNQNNTTFYYTCPEWILKKDKDVFAIDMSLVEEEKEGVYYVSPNIESEMSKLVLRNENGKLLVEKFQKQKDIIGIILSFEEKII
jgi:transcriptional regulator with XRE-family HTH domain